MRIIRSIEELEAIYVFCERHLNRARIERDPAKIEQVSELLGRLRDSLLHAVQHPVLQPLLPGTVLPGALLRPRPVL